MTIGFYVMAVMLIIEYIHHYLMLLDIRENNLPSHAHFIFTSDKDFNLIKY